MLFSTTIPQVKTYTPTPTFEGRDKSLLSLLGYNDKGERNTWGKIMPYTPFGLAGTTLGGAYAKHLAKDDNEMLQNNLNQSVAQNRNAYLGWLGLGAGAAATAAGAPQTGIPMIAQGIGQVGNNIQTFGEGGYIPGGSHSSGNDMAIVDKNTGADTGMRLEGDELLFSKDNSEHLRNAIGKKDLSLVYHIVKKQLKEGKPKQAGGEEQFAEGTNYRGIPNAQLDSPYAYGSFGMAQQGQPIFDTYPAPQPQPYMFGSQATTQPFSYANPNTWTTPIVNQPVSESITNPTTSGAGNYWNYVPGALQTIGGLMNTNVKVPTYTEPSAYSNYMSRLAQLSNQGYTPEERALINNDINNTYRLGLNRVKALGGGNSAAELATLTSLGNAMNEAKLKSAAEENAIRNRNLLNYGSALGTEYGMFTQPNQEWAMKKALMDKQAAAGLANTGIENLQGAATYNRMYNSPEYLALVKKFNEK